MIKSKYAKGGSMIRQSAFTLSNYDPNRAEGAKSIGDNLSVFSQKNIDLSRKLKELEEILKTKL